MTPADNAPGSREVAPGSDPTGNGDVGNISAIPSLSNPLVIAPGVNQTKTEKIAVEQPGEGEGDKTPPPVTTQLSDKDARHASKKINDEVEKRFNLSKRMVERDPDAIYDIAESDPDMAARLLKEVPDLDAESVQDLLDKRELGSQDLEAVKSKVSRTSSEVRKLQEQLQEERILRLKEKHPDLRDDLEEEFRTLYSDERFSDKTPEQLLAVARALSGKPAPTQETIGTDVAIDLIKQNEGAQTTVRGGPSNGGTKHETEQQRAMRMAFGHTEEDFKKYLPENIDQMLSF